MRVFLWSSLAVALPGVIVPLGALHALSTVLDLRKEGRRWRGAMIVLLLGAALSMTRTGLIADLNGTDQTMRARVGLELAAKEVATAGFDLTWGSSITFAANVQRPL